MVSDSAAPASASHANDFSKKKRANRSARLKQCKLDARREQWLSQVRNKGAVGSERDDKDLLSVTKLEVKARGDGGEEGRRKGSDSESSPFNSPGSVGSGVSSGNNVSGTCFTTGSSMSSSGSSGGMCSGNVTEEEEERADERDDGCVDDWEAIADALADDENKHASNSDPPDQQEFSPCSKSSEKGSSRVEIPKSQPLRASKYNRGTQSLRQDDTFLPHGLPILSKLQSSPLKSSRHLGRGAGGFKSFHNTKSAASACDCPICYEELDLTDASFYPCPCKFRLCLFCYKRICEDDGRCPGCREHYNN